jgi:hypothetical protein
VTEFYIQKVLCSIPTAATNIKNEKNTNIIDIITNLLKMGVGPMPETSCILNVPQIMDNISKTAIQPINDCHRLLGK